MTISAGRAPSPSTDTAAPTGASTLPEQEHHISAPSSRGPREYTWLDHLERHAAEIPDQDAVIHGELRLTWAGLHDQVREFAAHLHARGVRPGNRVAILMSNRPASIVAMLGAQELGAIAVPLNYRLTVRELTPIVERTSPTALVYEDAYRATASEVVEQGSVPITVHEQADLDFAFAGEAEAPAEASVEPLIEQSPASECAVIVFTSGSTGRPKGAMLSYANIMSQVLVAVYHFQITGGGSTLVNSPLFHIAGLANVFRCLVTGRTTVLAYYATFTPEAFLENLQKYNVTETYLISSLWSRVCKHMDAHGITHPLENLGWGAEPAGLSTLEAMARCFPQARIVSTFGQTEMSPVTTVLEPEYAQRKIGSVGVSAIAVRIRVVDEQMNDVPTGEVGEAVYLGPGLMMGYWDDPEATAESMQGGWFHSGDLVRKDEDGFYYVADRIKNIIISGGENIYSPEVEEAILLHPNVKETAVVGVPDEKWGEVPVAAVSLIDPSVETDEAEIIEHCRSVLASYKKPKHVYIFDELPRSGTGKISKPALRESFGQS
ncbi:fatty-acid--CoA ligase FadD5 [Brevibacterium daeguense]|uniref:Fatty-acid--CoA ligase FadD5 n=1 Tax=Brevibacterium daeguense TaxID=909936 RepID=A0ABP8EIH1_9MICO|nr:AMP-binding protein [Brevibacterium daeguense]